MEITEKGKRFLASLEPSVPSQINKEHDELIASEYRQLYSMMTVGEAADRWGLNVNTIKRQIMRGGLVGRKSKQDWIVTTESMTKRYGIAPKGWQDYE